MGVTLAQLSVVDFFFIAIQFNNTKSIPADNSNRKKTVPTNNFIIITPSNAIKNLNLCTFNRLWWMEIFLPKLNTLVNSLTLLDFRSFFSRHSIFMQ